MDLRNRSIPHSLPEVPGHPELSGDARTQSFTNFQYVLKVREAGFTNFQDILKFREACVQASPKSSGW